MEIARRCSKHGYLVVFHLQEANAKELREKLRGCCM